jgi:acetylornithine aminotransferase
MVAATGKPAYQAPFTPLPAGFVNVAWNDVEAIKRATTDETVAVLLEPIQGEAGVLFPPEGYLAAARQITTAHGALLWVDEVQTGSGRTGDWFAHAASGVTPDVVTLAKGLAGGIPIGACIAVGEPGALLQPGNHGTTFGGNPVAAAAALAVLDTIDKDGLLDNARRVGARLREGLEHPRVTEVRGAGLLVGLDLDADVAAAVVRVAQDAGFILNMTGPRTIRLAPPLNLSVDEAEELLDAWPTILDDAYASTGGD